MEELVMILIFSDDNDPTVDYVEERMDKRPVSYRRISMKSFFENYTISLIPGKDFVIKSKSSSFEVTLDDIECVWLRTFRQSGFEHNEEDKQNYVVEEWERLWIWFFDILPMNKVIGQMNSSMIASNKFIQLKVAESVGLKTPKTLVSSDKDDVVDFLELQSGGIAKTLSSFSVAEGWKLFKNVYTSRVSPGDFTEVESIAEAPVIFQEEIEKDYEVRVTFVGNKLFPCKIESQKSSKTEVDWRRYDFDNVPHSVIDLPEEVSNKLIQFLDQFSVRFGSFDMAVTPEGEYVFFEMNPNSQWVWLEKLTNLHITDAFIDLMLIDW